MLTFDFLEAGLLLEMLVFDRFNELKDGLSTLRSDFESDVSVFSLSGFSVSSGMTPFSTAAFFGFVSGSELFRGDSKISLYLLLGILALLPFPNVCFGGSLMSSLFSEAASSATVKKIINTTYNYSF